MIELLYMSAAFIAQVADYKGYIRPEPAWRNTTAENTKVQGPTMTEIYYQLCAEMARPPMQHEFVERYKQENREWFCSNPHLVHGMEYRVARAWPSFIAEHHLFALFAESGYFEAAHKNSADDLSSGTDMRLRRGEAFWHVASFTDTDNGWEMAWRKWGRGKQVSRPCLYLPLNFKGLPTPIICKGLHLYSPSHVAAAIEAMEHMKLTGMDLATYHMGICTPELKQTEVKHKEVEPSFDEEP